MAAASPATIASATPEADTEIVRYDSWPPPGMLILNVRGTEWRLTVNCQDQSEWENLATGRTEFATLDNVIVHGGHRPSISLGAKWESCRTTISAKTFELIRKHARVILNRIDAVLDDTNFDDSPAALRQVPPDEEEREFKTGV